LLHGQVGRLLALEDAIDVVRMEPSGYTREHQPDEPLKEP
jgi:hypothetical protein